MCYSSAVPAGAVDCAFAFVGSVAVARADKFRRNADGCQGGRTLNAFFTKAAYKLASVVF